MKLREIMVVDDSEADLLYTRVILEGAAVTERVTTFDIATDALAYLQRADVAGVDMILLDINMPEMNGFEFLAAYEQLPPAQQARCVIVMLTSSPDPSDEVRARAFPSVKGYAVKPIDRATVGRLVALVAGPAPDA